MTILKIIKCINSEHIDDLAGFIQSISKVVLVQESGTPNSIYVILYCGTGVLIINSGKYNFDKLDGYPRLNELRDWLKTNLPKVWFDIDIKTCPTNLLLGCPNQFNDDQLSYEGIFHVNRFLAWKGGEERWWEK